MLSQFHLNTTCNGVELRNDRWQPILQITLGQHIQFGLHLERSFTTDFPNYVRATYTIWVTLRKIFDNRFPKLREGDIYNLGYIKKRSLTTNSPNYVRATYTILVA